MPTPPLQSLSTFHQMFNGFPQVNSPLVQETGQVSQQWLPFFRQIWQSTQPNGVTLTAANAPIGSTGENEFTAGNPNQTIFVDLQPPAPVHIHLWDTPSLGWTIRVKDAVGADATHPITVHAHGSYLIDGQPTYVMHTSTTGDFDAVIFEFNGQNWSTF